MTLAAGARLGPYEIIAALGAGGMGEVYQARDPRLDRIVAIKVLPSSRADDPERLERFDREARAVAALSHPNICAIFDVGHAEGVAYLVMEYLDGVTLADRLVAGTRSGSGGRSVHSVGSDQQSPGTTPSSPSAARPLPVRETLGIAVQLANALAAAHNAGIVHRDLKPANIILLRSGSGREGIPQVKVLDFGLARMAVRTSEPLMTTAAPLTGIGTLVGTVPYMSPEQVEGREVDARSDIFSLGSVIYEMATGRRAFDAGSQAGVIAAILERQPEPMTHVQPMTPPGLERVVRTCLAKAPDDRWQHAGDVARQLSWLVAESESGAGHRSSSDAPTGAVTEDRGPSKPRVARWPIALAGVASLLLAGDVVWRLVRTSGRADTTTAIPVHFPLRVDGVAIQLVRVSPDGRTLAISGVDEDGRQGIWTQPLSEGRATQVPNLDPDAFVVGWSRDGTEIIYRSSRGVIAARLDSGLVRSLTPSVTAPVTAVGESDALSANEAGIKAFALGSGATRDLFSGLALRPRFLPDGKRFLYTSRADTIREGNPSGLYLSSVDAPQNRRLILNKRSSGVFADGSLLFVENGTLFAQPFDLERAELSGTARPVLDGAQYFHPNGSANFDAGAGTIVYQTPRPDDTPVWVDRTGAITGKLSSLGLYSEPRISPDGTRAIYSRRDRRQGTGDIWLQDLSKHTTVRLTNDEWSEAWLLWSPDGRTIAYGSDREGPPDVYLQEVDAGTPPRKIFATGGVDYPYSWLPDGRLLIWTAGELVTVKADGTVDGSFGKLERASTASPDGRWLAFVTSEGGERGIYVEPIARRGVRVRVWAGAVQTIPVWADDGRRLYFASGRQVMQAVVHAGDTFVSDPPAAVFTLDRIVSDFDVSPDGSRFVVLRGPARDSSGFHVLVNWRAALK
jgi:serine/threonine protein kinase/Tol biopolymer transport system component